jgi:hypothetical protein
MMLRKWKTYHISLLRTISLRHYAEMAGHSRVQAQIFSVTPNFLERATLKENGVLCGACAPPLPHKPATFSRGALTTFSMVLLAPVIHAFKGLLWHMYDQVWALDLPF